MYQCSRKPLYTTEMHAISRKCVGRVAKTGGFAKVASTRAIGRGKISSAKNRYVGWKYRFIGAALKFQLGILCHNVLRNTLFLN